MLRRRPRRTPHRTPRRCGPRRRGWASCPASATARSSGCAARGPCDPWPGPWQPARMGGGGWGSPCRVSRWSVFALFLAQPPPIWFRRIRIDPSLAAGTWDGLPVPSAPDDAMLRPCMWYLVIGMPPSKPSEGTAIRGRMRFCHFGCLVFLQFLAIFGHCQAFCARPFWGYYVYVCVYVCTYACV